MDLNLPNTISLDSVSEINRLIREKDLLSEEIRSLEVNYSNLFKLYEKMRENCVLLKMVSNKYFLISSFLFKNTFNKYLKKFKSLFILTS